MDHTKITTHLLLLFAINPARKVTAPECLTKEKLDCNAV